MNITSKCMPYGDLPYEEINSATKMMVKLFENVPYLPQFPKISPNDNLYIRTLSNIPGIQIKDKKCILKKNSKTFQQGLVQLDVAYNNPTIENIEPYKTDSVFFDKYLKIIKRIKPKETVVSLLGPFSISQSIINKDGVHEQFLADKMLRKFVIQAICVKAIWIINKIKEYSSDTVPIIMFEEPLLNRFGDVKRKFSDITAEIVINFYAKVFQKIKENNGVVGIQSFKKCNWTLPIKAGVDIISFDAYNNPNNLIIISSIVNDFLLNGGRINWGIVPVKNEQLIQHLTIDKLYNLFMNTVYLLVDSGVSEKLAFNNSMVSVQGNLDKLPLIFAEKALILTTQLSKKIPVKS